MEPVARPEPSSSSAACGYIDAQRAASYFQLSPRDATDQNARVLRDNGAVQLPRAVRKWGLNGDWRARGACRVSRRCTRCCAARAYSQRVIARHDLSLSFEVEVFAGFAMLRDRPCDSRAWRHGIKLGSRAELQRQRHARLLNLPHCCTCHEVSSVCGSLQVQACLLACSALLRDLHRTRLPCQRVINPVVSCLNWRLYGLVAA